ncbi:BON domain-containing protein [Neisseriaceae bacterium JH1-16]|nr:BON domain-containing protein [Neisseriaceae bacterium JH1-16]
MPKKLILAVLLSLPASLTVVGTVSAAQPLLLAAAQGKDAQLAKDVEGTVKPQAEQLGAQVTLVVKRGQVVLSGVAPSEDAIRQLVELASTVPGVEQVSSEIEVKPV